MTAFNKDDFSWDGMYLMYKGEHDLSTYYMGDVHPSRVGTVREDFIARFKYGSKPYKSLINFLVKNFTVEEYVNLQRNEDMSPVAICESKGSDVLTTKRRSKIWESQVEEYVAAQGQQAEPLQSGHGDQHLQIPQRTLGGSGTFGSPF
jgi:hypothetical protein